ncbi:MAG: OmpA family protein, partial [Muribaculaceae bacterium]|nr:OmpA family protein [Muribaculaceae bacterium]
VNRAEILTDYRRNPEELAKIRKSIDFVKDDADAQITSITIRGYASPDGPYANNERLAKARTEALVNYVQNLYSFPASIMHSAWVAEDWAGLRKYLEESDMEQRTAIIAVIDSDLAPDAKEQKIKKDFPKDYAFLLKNVYPGLRHTDYTVEYVIRTYTDVNEIAQIMKTSPNKLSLDELYLLGKSLNPESDEYAQVYDLAVRMYPSEPIANLNAAMVSMRRGDYAKTQEYLTKAGDSDQANYARGLLLAYNEQYEPALMTLTPLASKMPEAAQAVAQIQKILARLAK